MKKVILLSPLVHRATDPQWAARLHITRTCYTPLKLNELIACLNSKNEKPVGCIEIYDKYLKDNLRLLIAEDDKDNQFLMQCYLSKEKAQLTFADNGEIALSLYKAKPRSFDLLVTDVRMPVMDGFSLIENLREYESSHDLKPIPILVLTADAQSEQVKIMKMVGGNEYLTKPIARTALLEKISAYQRTS